MVGVHVLDRRRLRLGDRPRRVGLGEHSRRVQPPRPAEAADPMEALDRHPEDPKVSEVGVERRTRVAGEKTTAQPRLGVRSDSAERGEARPGLRVGAPACVLDEQRGPRIALEVAGVVRETG